MDILFNGGFPILDSEIMDNLRTDTLGGKPPSRNGHGIDRGRLPMIGIEFPGYT